MLIDQSVHGGNIFKEDHIVKIIKNDDLDQKINELKNYSKIMQVIF